MWDKSHQRRAVRKFRQRVECGLLTTCDELHKLTRVYRLRAPEDDPQTSLTGDRGQTQPLTHRGQTNPKSPACRAGEDAPLLPKNQFPAEGPLFQPSLALNIDPAKVSFPLSLIQPDRHNSLSSSSPRALYQIKPRAHPVCLSCRRGDLCLSLFQSQTPAVR